MLWFRGPARIKKVLSNTTFELEYKGRTYKRCLSELRKFKAAVNPTLDMGVAPDSTTDFKLGAVTWPMWRGGSAELKIEQASFDIYGQPNTCPFASNSACMQQLCAVL